jgi:hypothetical protein
MKLANSYRRGWFGIILVTSYLFLVNVYLWYTIEMYYLFSISLASVVLSVLNHRSSERGDKLCMVEETFEKSVYVLTILMSYEYVKAEDFFKLAFATVFYLYYIDITKADSKYDYRLHHSMWHVVSFATQVTCILSIVQRV